MTANLTTRKRELSRRKNRLVAIQIIRQGMTIHNALAWIARDDSQAIEQLKSVLIIERLNGFRLCNPRLRLNRIGIFARFHKGAYAKRCDRIGSILSPGCIPWGKNTLPIESAP